MVILVSKLSILQPELCQYCPQIRYLKYSVYPLLSAGGGGERILGMISILEKGCWERGGHLFQGGFSFFLKNKLKSEIFNDKKNLYIGGQLPKTGRLGQFADLRELAKKGCGG